MHQKNINNLYPHGDNCNTLLGKKKEKKKKENVIYLYTIQPVNMES